MTDIFTYDLPGPSPLKSSAAVVLFNRPPRWVLTWIAVRGS